MSRRYPAFSVHAPTSHGYAPSCARRSIFKDGFRLRDGVYIAPDYGKPLLLITNRTTPQAIA